MIKWKTLLRKIKVIYLLIKIIFGETVHLMRLAHEIIERQYIYIDNSNTIVIFLTTLKKQELAIWPCLSNSLCKVLFRRLKYQAASVLRMYHSILLPYFNHLHKWILSLFWAHRKCVYRADRALHCNTYMWGERDLPRVHIVPCALCNVHALQTSVYVGLRASQVSNFAP